MAACGDEREGTLHVGCAYHGTQSSAHCRCHYANYPPDSLVRCCGCDKAPLRGFAYRRCVAYYLPVAVQTVPVLAADLPEPAHARVHDSGGWAVGEELGYEAGDHGEMGGCWNPHHAS